MSSFNIENYCNRLLQTYTDINLTKDECINILTSYKKNEIPLNEDECNNIIFTYIQSKKAEQLKKETEIRNSYEQCYNKCKEFIPDEIICNKIFVQYQNKIITPNECDKFIRTSASNLPKQPILSFGNEFKLKQINKLKKDIVKLFKINRIPEDIAELLADQSISDELIDKLKRVLSTIQRPTYIPEPVIPIIIQSSFNKQQYESQINKLLLVLQQKINSKFNKEKADFFYTLISTINLYFEEDYKNYIDSLTDINNHFDEYSEEMLTIIIKSLVSSIEENKRRKQILIENERRAREEAERRAKEAREEAERKAREEAERRAREEAERKAREEAERREAERRAKEAREEAERRAREEEHPPYKPFMLLPIRNFKWRGNLCWMYAYLQYIYRIQCIHDLILGNNVNDTLNISYISTTDDTIQIKIDFTKPSLRQYNGIIDLKNILVILKDYKNVFRRVNNTDDKNNLQTIFNNIYTNILTNNIIINKYIIISLWIIFNFLQPRIRDEIINIYNKINIYGLFNNKEFIDNIEDFIHIFILIIAYSVNHEIYSYNDPMDLNNLFIKRIFTCLNTENLYNIKYIDQTCFILFASSHYINLIQNSDNSYYIVDSRLNDIFKYNEHNEYDIPIEQIIKNNIKEITFPVSFKKGDLTYTYNTLYGGNNSFNKYKSKYNIK